MAHPAALRQQVRAGYVFEALSLESLARRHSIGVGTIAKWKKRAQAAGDDWDKLRAANLLAGQGGEAVARQMLTEYVVQHQSVVAGLKEATDMSPAVKAEVLASLADSFNKTVSAARRILPETNELAVAVQVVQLLVDYVRTHAPASAPALLEILEPFGEHVATRFSR